MAIKNIMVCVAAEGISLITVKYAIALAKILQARLSAIYVVNERLLRELLKSKVLVDVEARGYEKELEEQGSRFIERIKSMSEKKGVVCDAVVLKGIVHEEVMKQAGVLNPDMLVMGELREVLSLKETFYDEGERIFREAPCPVVVVKNASLVEKLYNEL
ncbi:MAG: universal stress protein [Candidatus Omnitrophota bacterium]|jgi:nucleotide-binding universal stress UspA family protein|nr:universal stress protein [Candidatus Omnitrophota bacterium]